MTGRQWFFASLIIVGLLAVIWWGFRPTDDPFDVAFPETTTTAQTTPTTTTTTSAPSTTTPEPTTTTTTAEQRLEEVREIMENLWVGWFTEIAEGDSDGLWAYAATQRVHDVPLEVEPPELAIAPEDAAPFHSDLQILLDREDCLVVYEELDFSGMYGFEAKTAGVAVLWPDPRYGWRFASDWTDPGDLWINDCDLTVRPETP